MFTRDFIVKYVGNVFIALVIVVLALSFYNGGIDTGSIAESLGLLFGGVASLLGVLGIVLIGAAFIGVYHLAKSNQNGAATILAFVLFILGAFVGVSWIELPRGSVWMLIGLLVLVFIQTMWNLGTSFTGNGQNGSLLQRIGRRLAGSENNS